MSCLWWALLVLCWKSAFTMEYFNIGGMFSPYNEDGSMNEDEIQALAAFRMAIDEVNADPSLLPGYTVRGTFRNTYSTASAVTATLALSKTAFGAGVDITMGTLNAAQSMIAIEIFAHYVMPHMVISDTDSILSQAPSYPYHLRIVPSQAYEVRFKRVMLVSLTTLIRD